MDLHVQTIGLKALIAHVQHIFCTKLSHFSTYTIAAATRTFSSYKVITLLKALTIVTLFIFTAQFFFAVHRFLFMLV